jgi:hypothetical protein
LINPIIIGTPLLILIAANGYKLAGKRSILVMDLNFNSNAFVRGDAYIIHAKLIGRSLT